MSKSISITITITTVNIRIPCWSSCGHSMYAGYSIQESIRGCLTEVDAQMNGLAQSRSSSVRPDDEGLACLSDLEKTSLRNLPKADFLVQDGDRSHLDTAPHAV